MQRNQEKSGCKKILFVQLRGGGGGNLKPLRCKYCWILPSSFSLDIATYNYIYREIYYQLNKNNLKKDKFLFALGIKKYFILHFKY